MHLIIVPAHILKGWQQDARQNQQTIVLSDTFDLSKDASWSGSPSPFEP